MTRADEPNNYDRQMRHFNRRLERLEDTQIAPQEFERAFDRVYDEIDALEDQMNQRFDRLEARMDRLETRFDRLETRLEERFNELDRKFDIVMRHITGQN
jgi:DNA repair ATPase RecN